MVQLTKILLKYTPPWFELAPTQAARYFKKYNVYRMTKTFYGKSRNCYRIARRKLMKKLEYEDRDRKERCLILRDLFSQRILAACKENDYPYHHFIGILPQMNIELDRYSLSNLAIWEPRTFKALIELAKEYRYVNPKDPLGVLSKPETVISRRFLKEPEDENN